ncbi:MAG: ADP-ribosylglycohydrolase family protein [Proteobacteria bacterium]|nr:ADP-ribosylglycohydrolase family protein [Pseudomonadota bacterium]
MLHTSDPLFSRFAGSALGAFIGDALGMAVEGQPHELILETYGGMLDDMWPGRFPAGHYTDDTEMAISLLEVLAATGDLDPALLARHFTVNFHPERGYGGRIYGIMSQLAAGEAWDRVGTDSFGNGAAMRVAPAGFYFYDDLDRAAQEAARQASITHRHPEALAGAVIQAGAVAMATRAGLDDAPLFVESFLRTLAGLARDHDELSATRLLAVANIQPGETLDVIAQIRGLFQCDVKAIEAVPPAIAAFLMTTNFREAVLMAVNLGGDADTIGAMAGAIAGAYYGFEALPAAWLDRLENGDLGRDYVINLCRQAAQRKAAAG